MRKISAVALCLMMLALAVFAPMSALADAATQTDATSPAVQTPTDSAQTPTDSVQTADIVIAATATSVGICGWYLSSTTSYYHNGSNGIQGTADNDPSGANAHYDPATGILTLTRLNVATTESSMSGIPCAIFADGDITIVLNGDSTVSTSDRINSNIYGVYVDGALTVSGSSMLTAAGGGTSSSSYGVRANTITVNGGTIEGNGGNASTSYGVYASEGSVTANGGNISGTAGVAQNNGSYGIFAPSGSVSANGTNSSITGIGAEGASSYGMWVKYNIDAANGGSIAGTSAAATDRSYGLYSEQGFVNADGGTITGYGGTVTGNDPDDHTSKDSYGVFTRDRCITAKAGGSITGIGSRCTAVKGESCGVKSGLYISADGGAVSGIGGQASGILVKSYGVNAKTTITVSSGANALAQGHTRALGTTTNLSGTAAASVDYDGSGMGTYDPASWTDYKFFRAPHTVAGPDIILSQDSFPSGQAPADATVTVGSGLTGFNATNSFLRATMNGTEIDLGKVGTPGTDGSIRNGSIIIQLDQAYLNGLAAGTYPLRVYLKGYYVDQFVDKTITVTAAPALPVPPHTTPSDNPATGDTADIALWTAVAILAAGALVIAEKKRRA